MITKYPTQSELDKVFELRVDFRNGHETLWRKGSVGKDGRVLKDKIVECKVNHSAGYCNVQFKGRMVYYHTIVFILVNGDIPEGLVVLHKDSHSKLCNQSSELRIGTPRKNLQEKQIHLDGKLCGCSYRKQSEKWQAQISINDKDIHLGYYDTEIEAHKVYNKADKMRADGFGSNFIQRILMRTKDSCSSQYKGVYWNKRRNKWKAGITIKKNKIFLGYYDTEQEASAVYNKAKQLIDHYVDPRQFRNLLKG